MRRIWFSLLSLLLVGVLVLAAVAVSIVKYSHVDEKTPCDVAIVLGAGTSDGELSPVYRERVNHGIWLYQNDYVDYLILTGGVGKGNTLSDAYTAKLYAVACGVPEEAVYIEEVSTITEENLVEAKKIMVKQGWEEAILVSDPLHMKRAMFMTGDYGIKAYSSPTPTSMYKTVKTQLPFLAREDVLYIGYAIVRLFR